MIRRERGTTVRSASGRRRELQWARPLLAFFLAAQLGSGCASAHNYVESDAPRYVGQHSAVAPPGRDIRVVTFNIQHSRRIPKAIEILRTHAALRDLDVLALQEMDAPGVQAIARALGLNYIYFPASRGPGHERDMGTALLSPWPIEESWKLTLPHLTRVVHRSRAAVALLSARFVGVPQSGELELIHLVFDR